MVNSPDIQRAIDLRDTATMELVARCATLGEGFRYPGDEWRDYPLTVTRAGREYPLATLTVYDDDARGVMILPHYDYRRLQVTRAAWQALEDALGYPPLEPWQTPRAWLVDVREDAAA